VTFDIGSRKFHDLQKLTGSKISILILKLLAGLGTRILHFETNVTRLISRILFYEKKILGWRGGSTTTPTASARVFPTTAPTALSTSGLVRIAQPTSAASPACWEVPAVTTGIVTGKDRREGSQRSMSKFSSIWYYPTLVKCLSLSLLGKKRIISGGSRIKNDCPVLV